MERDEKMIHQEFDLKRELAQQAGSQKSVKDEVKLTKNMTIPDMVKVMMPEIKKALPTVLTPERFTRIALSALNNTPALQKCTPMSFLCSTDECSTAWVGAQYTIRAGIFNSI